jgi:predicted CXXCH cytochrome family protein
MSNATRRLIIILLGVGLTLIIAGLAPLVLAQDTGAQVETPPETPAEATEEADYSDIPAPTGDNSYCGLCHSLPWRSVNLASGETLTMYVIPEMIAGSVHGTSNEWGALGCVDCHGNAFPHSGPQPTDLRSFTISRVDTCKSCHEEEHAELEQGLHAAAIAGGNMEAAVCSDCHGAHDVQPVAAERLLVAGMCGECHSETVSDWRISPHVDIGPLGCASCHSSHTQELRVGETGNDMCINCHKIMPQQWVHDKHIDVDSPVGCTDCHMYSPPLMDGNGQMISITNAMNNPASHTMSVASRACNDCHAELVATGEWVTIAEARASEATGTQATVEQAGMANIEAQQNITDYVSLFQGLILGLGVGLTAAVVFISRGNPMKSSTKQETK